MAMLAGCYLLLQNSAVQTYIINKITEQLTRKSNAKISIGKVDFAFFNRIVLNDVLIAGPENDTIFYSGLVSARIDTLKISERRLVLSELSFFKNQFSVNRDSANHFNFSFILESFRAEKKDTTVSAYWKISCNQFNFQNSELDFHDLKSKTQQHYFINEMNLNVTDFMNYADSTSFKINSLTLNYDRLLFINQLSAKVVATKSKIEINEMNIESNHSAINDVNLLLQFGDMDSVKNNELNFDLQLSKSRINLTELSELIPAMNGMDDEVEVSGRVYGNLSDIKGKDLIIRTGEKTNATFDFYVNGIKDIETMYLFLDLKQLETTIDDVASFNIVRNGKKIQLHLPESLYNSGLISFKGNFSGFLSDFVAFGTMESRMGIIKTDVSVIPKKDGLYSYKGKITTTDFNLGRLLNSNNIGKITFNGNVDGDYKISDKKISGLFKGEIAKLEANDYVYENIKLDGFYKEKMFDGMVIMNDSNLQFDFQGRLDMSKETPNFDFNLNVDKLVPGNLHYSGNFYQSEIAFNMKVNFTGDKIDNLNGVIVVDEGYYKNKNGSFSLNGIKLISVPQKDAMELTFNSDYFDVIIDGNYQFQDIWNSLKSNMNKFIPAMNFTTPANLKSNLFDYRITFKNLDDLTSVFLPELQIETPFFLYGKMDSKQSDFQLEGSIPGFQYKNFWFRNVFISNKVYGKHYVSKLKFSEVLHKKGASIYNLAVDSEVANNILHNKIDWNAHKDSTGYSSIQSYSVFSPSDTSSFPKVKVEFLPSEIFLTDTVWQLNPFTANIDSSKITINDFKLFQNNQNIEIAGVIAKDSTKLLSVNFKNIDIGYFQKSLMKANTVKGILNFSLNVSQLYSQPLIIADANIENLSYKNQLVGDVVFNSSWDRLESEIESQLKIIKNGKLSLSAEGSYTPKTKAINYIVKADSLPIKLLETVLTNPFSDFNGTTSGLIKISGTPAKIFMDGATKVSNGSLVIDYTQTKYFIDDSVYFKSDAIQFRNLTFSDVHKNKAILNGKLVHDNFSNMLYDLTIVSPKIKVMNTTLKYNEQFYGDVFANCKLKVQGKGLKVALSGSLTTLPGTNVNISMEYENAIEQYDFLEFINSQEVVNKDMFFYDPPKTDFTISFNIEVTPDAKTQLVYNSQIGDIIKAEGEGILLFEMNKYGDISLAGDYTVVKGDYLFTLQSILNKRFTIAPGGSIVWSGDPYNAVIDLSAIYSLKTSLSDLQPDANYLYQRIPVECIIVLTDELINPTINFKINFPEQNEGEKSKLEQFFNTEEEINKQILSLIVLGKFYTPEYMRGQYETQNPNMIGTTASELFSNQLSNWLSQISQNVDVGFKYRPGNSITNDELELALSTQILNDRVILNGNIGNNVNPESNSNSQIVGDFDMRVKLTPNGKVQLKVYNHSNNDLIYETAPYTQGVGFSFKEEYNSFEELMHKIGSIFKKKDK
ncbi:MAG TPA: translocation/assembly module TamB domain-containing protein [Draconibacterium sp.]|nr:translocation/assembly module TamB domain-containing protein [Draconibacterium sp.]